MGDNDRVAVEVEVNLRMDKIKEQLRIFAKETGTSLETAFRELNIKGDFSTDEGIKALQELKNEAKRTEEAARNMAEAMKKPGEATPVIEKLKTAFGGLWDVIGKVSAALLAMQVFNFLKQQISEAIKIAEEFSQSMYRLEVSIRAMQRAGSEVTFESTWQGIQKMREEFGVFATKDLVAGYAQMYNLTRELGLAEEETQNLIDASATLAIVTGQNVAEAQRMMAMALSSGYTEGLQRLGIAISRYSIALKANEMGLGENYMALSEHERALATYAIIMEQVARYQEDATEYTNTYAGSIKESKTILTDIKTELGEKLLPVWANFLKLLVFSVDAWTKLSVVLTPFIPIIQSIGSLLTLTFSTLKDLSAFISGDKTWEEWGVSAEKALQKIKTELANIWKFWKDGTPQTTLGDTDVGDKESSVDAISSNLDDVTGDIEGIWEEHYKRLEELALDYQDDLEKIERDGANRREELARDLAYRLEELTRKYNQNVAKAGRDYQNTLAKIHNDQQSKLAEITQKYRDKELDEEAKHVEALRKLRERLIFDVEEAARTRDASSARKALREYQLERAQTIRDYEIGKESRARDYQRDIEEARRAEQQKREDALIAYQQRLEDLKIQYEYERNEAQIKYKQDLEELRISMANQRKERMISYQKQQQDLIKAYNARLQAIAKALVAEYGLIVNAGKAVTQAMYAIYGPGSAIDQILKYFHEQLATVGDVTGSSVFGGVTAGGSALGAASGGTFYASQPTLMAVGEDGLEKVTVEPIGYRGATENMVFGNSGADYSGMSGGKVGVDIFLSPDLEGRIIRKSNDVMSNELVKILRRRK